MEYSTKMYMSMDGFLSFSFWLSVWGSGRVLFLAFLWHGGPFWRSSVPGGTDAGCQFHIVAHWGLAGMRSGALRSFFICSPWANLFFTLASADACARSCLRDIMLGTKWEMFGLEQPLLHTRRSGMHALI